MKNLPKIALGTWPWGIGMIGGDQVFGNHLDIETLKPIFKTAMSKGINLWNTATVYGIGASEVVLDSFTKRQPREDIIISTKFSP